MAHMRKLPDAEFEIMKAIWGLTPPITAGMLTDTLMKESQKVQKSQTIHTLLNRLVDRGFLETKKVGKDRFFSPIIEEKEYVQFETQNFVKQYHGNSCLNLLSALYSGEALDEKNIEEIMHWIDEQRAKNE